MKKIYVSLFALAASSAVFGQSNMPLLRSYGSVESSIKTEKPVSDQEKAVALWEDDFSNNALWDIANQTADAQNWEITTLVSTDAGYGTGTWEDVDNVSDENGYALFDSDAVGVSGGSQDATITYNTDIDLTTYPNAVINFKQRGRQWQTTQTFVSVSSDGGTTWTDFEVNASEPLSVAYENEASVNISSAINGGTSTVRVRFRYVGQWDYMWSVDDVAIYEQPADDIQLLSAYVSGENNEGFEYGSTPLSQVDANYFVGVKTYNFGVSDQTNVAVAADFTNGFTSNFAVGTIVSGDTVDSENLETPTFAVGMYPGVFTGVSDNETAGEFFDNNTYNRYFEITDADNGTYALDGINVHDAADLKLSSLGTNSFTGEADGVYFATAYHIKQSQNFWGIEIGITSSTVVDAQVVVHIVDTASFFADAPSPLYSSLEYFITQTDINNGYARIPFFEQVTLAPDAYFAAVECFSGGNTADIRILDDQTVAQPAWASMIYLPVDGASYTNGEALAVRLLAGTLGVEENELTGVNVYPNPSNGVINVSNDNNVENTITVYTVSGAVVATKVASSATTIDLSTVGNGVYLVEVANENGKKVERVVIR